MPVRVGSSEGLGVIGEWVQPGHELRKGVCEELEVSCALDGTLPFFVGLVFVIPEEDFSLVLAVYAKAYCIAKRVIHDPQEVVWNPTCVAVAGPLQREVRLLSKAADVMNSCVGSISSGCWTGEPQ